MKKVLLISAVFILLCGSCYIIRDEEGTHLRLSPGVADTIEKVGEGTTDLLSILSGFLPILAPFATAAGAGTYVFKKMKKDVTKYKTPLDHVVTTIESVKEDCPDVWESIKGKFSEHSDADIEKVINHIINLNKNLKETT